MSSSTRENGVTSLSLKEEKERESGIGSQVEWVLVKGGGGGGPFLVRTQEIAHGVRYGNKEDTFLR